MTYDDLLVQADEEELIVREKPLSGRDGQIYGNRVAIRRDLSSIQKACVLAEELGHYYTSTGDILDLSSADNCRQEQCARLWGYRRMITTEKLVDAKKAGCHNLHEIADYLEVTEEYLHQAIEKYRSIYGTCYQKDNYLIIFEPAFDIYEYGK